MGDAGVDTRLGLGHLLQHERHVGDDHTLGQVMGQGLLLRERRKLYHGHVSKIIPTQLDI